MESTNKNTRSELETEAIRLIMKCTPEQLQKALEAALNVKMERV